MSDTDFDVWRTEVGAGIVGNAPPLIAALETIQRVASSDCNILITGETGTGKELFARAVHRASSRRHGPFVAVNCAAIPETLLESDLFGHIKGAFTGAQTARSGRFASADGGTLFLDEIGDLPLSAQATLLRVLEERVVSPVGSDVDVPIDVRIVAATHCDLAEMVAQKKFRADLYFRLAVVPLHLPALRDRGEDIDLIVDSCVARVRQRTGRPVAGLDTSARSALHAYSWPGNVRELAHVLERAVLLAQHSMLTAKDLDLPRARATKTVEIAAEDPIEVEGRSLDLRRALEGLERRLIDRALTMANGNRTEAAALLGLNRTTLVEKLRKFAA